MPKLKPIQKAILQALRELGGAATAREIAKLKCLPVNGVVQSLNQALDPRGYVVQISAYAQSETCWQLVEPPPDTREGEQSQPSPQLRMAGL